MKKLPKSIRKIAKKAGFVFWKKESWGPGKGHIDWGSQYDNEMFEFVRLLELHFRNETFQRYLKDNLE